MKTPAFIVSPSSVKSRDSEGAGRRVRGRRRTLAASVVPSQPGRSKERRAFFRTHFEPQTKTPLVRGVSMHGGKECGRRPARERRPRARSCSQAWILLSFRTPDCYAGYCSRPEYSVTKVSYSHYSWRARHSPARPKPRPVQSDRRCSDAQHSRRPPPLV